MGEQSKSVEPNENLTSRMQISRAHLGNALAFRIKLDDPEDLVQIVNLLRFTAKLIVEPDGLDNLIGFIRNLTELIGFIKIVQNFNGRYGLGASNNNDSQFAIAKKMVNEEPVYAFNFTGSNTNAASRVVMYEALRGERNHLFFSTKNIQSHLESGQLVAFRYLDEGQIAEIEREEKRTGDIRTRRLVGAKEQIMQRIEIDKAFFDGDKFRNTDLELLFDKNGEESVSVLDSRFELKETQTEKEELAGINVELTSFSKKIHEFSKMAAYDPDALKKRDEYLDLILRFYDTIENHVVKSISESSDPKVKGLLGRVKLFDLMGDEGGVACPAILEGFIVDAVKYAIKSEEFRNFVVRVTLTFHENISLWLANTGRVLVPPIFDNSDRLLVKYLESHPEIPEDVSIIVKIGSNNDVDILEVFDRI